LSIEQAGLAMRRFIMLFGVAIPTVLYMQSWVPVADAQTVTPDMVLVGGKIVTLDARHTIAQALAVSRGRISAIGTTAKIRKLAGPGTRIVQLGGRTVIPGLIDSHIHALRDALSYSTILDWSGVSDLRAGLGLIKEAARKASPGAWIAVVGGWHKDQLAERRAPTPNELDDAAPDHPVYVQHQFDFAVLNRQAIRVLEITAETSMPPAGKVELDANGAVTGIITGSGNARTMSQLAGRVIHPTFEQQVASVPRYFRALNRLALTGIIDEGISGTRDDYQPIFEVWRKGGFTLRVRYDVMGLKAGGELAELKDLLKMIPPGWGDEWLRLLGLGEIVINGMYDGSVVAKDVPPPPDAQKALLETATWAARNGFAIHIHASHDGTAAKILDVFEAVDKTVPITSLRWEISHIEDASDETLRRMKAMGVGYAVQNRMYFGGDAYISGHDPATIRRSPPIMTAMRLGVPVSGGTDANIPAPYNPFVSLRWLLDGRTLTGVQTRSQEELPSREEALRFYTLNSAWLSFEERDRGSLEPQKLADLAVLDRDYMMVPVNEVAKLHSMLTLVGGKPVYAEGPFAPLETMTVK